MNQAISQATGWPSRRRSPGWAMPTSRPRRLQTGVEVPGPSRWPTAWPACRSAPSSTSASRRNTPTDGAMIMRSGNSETFASRVSYFSRRVTRTSRIAFGRIAFGSIRSFGGGDVVDRDVRRAALGQRREHRAVPPLEKVSAPAPSVPPWSASARAPTRARRGGCASPPCRSRPRRRDSPRWGPTVLRTDRRELTCEPDGRVVHERRVERAADLERGGALDAHFLGACRRGVDAVGSSRDHDLPGGVVVGDPASRGAARRWCRLARSCSSRWPSGWASAVPESVPHAVPRSAPLRRVTVHPTRMMPADLAERGLSKRTVWSGSGCIASRHDQRGEQHREVALAGASEIVGGGVGDEVADGLTERGFRFVDHPPGRVVAPGRRQFGSAPGRKMTARTVLPRVLEFHVLDPGRVLDSSG